MECTSVPQGTQKDVTSELASGEVTAELGRVSDQGLTGAGRAPPQQAQDAGTEARRARGRPLTRLRRSQAVAKRGVKAGRMAQQTTSRSG